MDENGGEAGRFIRAFARATVLRLWTLLSVRGLLIYTHGDRLEDGTFQCARHMEVTIGSDDPRTPLNEYRERSDPDTMRPA